MSDCGHDGWVAGCPICESEEEAALRAMGEPDTLPSPETDEGDTDEH